jgi:hypothetical protein
MIGAILAIWAAVSVVVGGLAGRFIRAGMIAE